MPTTKKLLKKLFFILLLFIYLSQVGIAGEQIVLNPDGTNSNQNQINEAIEQAAGHAEGITVFLTDGAYLVDNTIIMRSNVRLMGDPGAIIRVSSTSSQWFTGRTGVISCQESIKNAEIAGFQIDGNIKSLPPRFADSRSDTDHDCEKLIILGGYSNDFAENIKIHDMKFYNSFSDAVYIIYADGVSCYNNFISNCQHEGVYFSVVRNGHIHNNKIAGITSDCARLDNCDTCLIEYNLFFSYGGESYGAYKHGENGLQIGDAKSSHGYNAVKKGYPTRNIEVRFNTFSDPGLKAIWLHGGENVFIHDNEFVDASVLETMGIPIGDISTDNQPTVEISEEVFSTIFDILNLNYTTTAKTEYTPKDFDYDIKETERGKIAAKFKIVGWNNLSKVNNISYVSSPDDIIIESEVIKNPSLQDWHGGISKINKTISVKIENGTANATMTVSVKWHNYEKDSKTGAKQKGKMHISNYTFNDSCPAPNIWEEPETIRGIVYQYPTYFMLSVPENQNITSVRYENETDYAEHIFLVGYKNTTSDGTKYTEFESLDHWEGDLTRQGDWICSSGVYSPENFTVTVNTPYKTVNVTDIEVIKKELPDTIIAYWFYPTLLFFGSLYITFKFFWNRLPFH